MIKTISKNDLVSCIASVKNAGDKDRSIVNYSEASILILFVNNYMEKTKDDNKYGYSNLLFVMKTLLNLEFRLLNIKNVI